MMKKLSKIGLSIVLMLTLVFGQASVVKAQVSEEQQVTMIKERLKAYFLELDTIDDGAKVKTCYVSHADEYLAMIQDDGSFADVKYDDTTNAANGKAWSPYLALDRLQAITIAYHKEDNPLYQKKEVVDKLSQALVYWQSQNPRATNWWENQVGVQLRFCRMALFMDGILSEETQNIMLNKMLEKKPVKHGTGQNNLWFDQNYVYHAIITNDYAKLKNMVNEYLSYCLVTQLDNKTAEAVQVDNSFYMHGKQFYSNGYGMSMFRDMSFWIYMLRGTDFALGQDVVDRMANYMLNGTRWTIRGDLIELYLGYRPYKYEVGYKNYAYEYIEPLKRMRDSDPVHALDYQNIINNIEGKSQSNGKNGNYYMWRSGYASSMHNGYGVNVKMDSKDVIGGEWRGSWPAGSDNGQLIYWTSSASSTVAVDGDEYISVYPVYDWAHTPGTTTPNRIPKDYANYGRLTNGHDHMIGVSNGQYGATAYVMNKKSTQASKGYFFFDDEFVALGSGINSTETTAIHTTLNQSQADGILVDGQAVNKGIYEATKTIYNDQIGYVLLNDTKAKVSYDDQKDMPSLWPEEQKAKASSVFSAYVDHGVKPSDASYAYVVVPNKTATQVEAYSNNVPITVVANNKTVQAVRHDGLKQTQINFYQAGTLEYKDGYKVTVNKPCSLIIDESGAERLITVAVTDQQANESVEIKLQYDNQTTVTGFLSKNTPYAGQSLTLKEGADNRYSASSSTSTHEPIKAYDQNETTYWESAGNGEQYITLLTDSQQFIKDVDILWGDHYATQYDVYGSNDGTTYQLLASLTQGDGQKDKVSIGGIYNYIKIVLKDGPAQNYQIKEVSFQEAQLLSLKKPVEVSSAYNTELKKENAVDGSHSTRWGSRRDTQNEWISVDLGRNAKIDAVEVFWEAASSDDYAIEVSSDNKTWKEVKRLKADSDLSDQIILDESVEARYVRIHSYKTRIVNGKNYGISIFELKVYGDYTHTNIALNQAVEVSSVYRNDVKIQGKYAVDGQSGTKWSSNRTQDEWIIVDLGDQAYLDGVEIDWETGCSDDYSIEVSADKETWTTVKEHLKTTRVASSDKHYIDTVDFDDTLEGRYVRIHSIKSRTKYGVNIWELRVLGVLQEEQEPEVDYGENIALNKPSQASSEFTDKNDGNKTYQSSLAFDGNTDKIDGKQSRWVSLRRKDNPGVDVDSQYIQVDLENSYKLSKVVLNWEGAGAKEYKLQVSLDGKTWTDVAHISDGTGGIKEFEFDTDVIARYVRMEGIEPGGQYGYSLWEFEVYGKVVEVDKVALQNELEVAEDIHQDTYTTDSLKDFNTAYQTAKAVYENEKATQTQVDQAIENLQKAIKELVIKVDKESAKDYIESIDEIDYSKYTEESGAVYKQAYAQLKDMLNDLDNVSVDEFAKAKETFENAIKGLVELPEIDVDPDKPGETDKPSVPDKPGETDKPEQTEKPDSSTQTDDHTNIALPVTLLALATLSFVLIQKRKKSC